MDNRYIDVDEFVDRLKKEILVKFDYTEVIDVEDLKSVINNMPITDVVEVIRCKDCVNRIEFEPNKYQCKNTGYYCGETGYCSDGVKKEDNQ